MMEKEVLLVIARVAAYRLDHAGEDKARFCRAFLTGIFLASGLTSEEFVDQSKMALEKYANDDNIKLTYKYLDELYTGQYISNNTQPPSPIMYVSWVRENDKQPSRN